jgi:hypothetical protein
MQRVDVAEVSPAVVQAAPHFDYGNHAASKNPKVHVLLGDAYRFLVRGEDRYDVIASEPSNPWVTGVENLFSVEFLQTAKRRLAPGGVWAQWFHVYETDTDTVALVLRTYARVFDHVAVWYSLGVDLVVLGFDDDHAALDLARLEQRAATPAFRQALMRARIESFPGLLAHELLPVGVVNAATLPGPIHTLAKPILSHQAARAFFRRTTAQLPRTVSPAAAAVGAERSLLRLYAARHGGLSEEAREAVARQLCNEGTYHECAAFLAAWAHEVPVSPARDAAIERLARNASDLAQAAAKAVPQLAPLVGPGARRSFSVEEAGHLTDLFALFYFHAAPFDREALSEIWSRCVDEEEGGARCRRNLELANDWIGGLVTRTREPSTEAAVATPVRVAPSR